jgi:hypothetical protein
MGHSVNRERVARRLSTVVLAGALAGCSRAAPPSQFPTADDAIARLRSTYACSRGVQGESKVDYFGEQGRVRGSTMFVAARPESVRFDVFSPFGVTLSTLTSDGTAFSLLDITSKQFFMGPASECNVERFLHVPVPPHALVTLLSGVAPVLVHDSPHASIAWESGHYVVRIESKNDATEVIGLEPIQADFGRPWSEQRVRLNDVTVRKRGVELYTVTLDDFQVAHTAKPRTDPDGIDPDVPPSGPACDVEVPRHLRIVSEASGQDVLLLHRDLALNPPLTEGIFRQSPPPGTRVVTATCH